MTKDAKKAQKKAAKEAGKGFKDSFKDTVRSVKSAGKTLVNATGIRKKAKEKGESYVGGYILGEVTQTVAAAGAAAAAGKGLKGAKAAKKTKPRKSNGLVDAGSSTKLTYVTSNGLVLKTTPNKTTTVLGTYKSDTGAILNELGDVKSLDFGPRNGGFNLLNTPDELYISPKQFWSEYNKPWLDNAIERNDIFKMATEPVWNNLTRVNMLTGKTELTGFGREYTYLKKHGYYFDTVTKTMTK